MSREFQHARRILALRLPRVGEVLSLWMHPHRRTPEITDILRRAEVRRLVTRPGGAEIDGGEARAIVEDPASWTAYQRARDLELTAATEGGSVLAQCPHCQEWIAELSPLAVAIALRSRFWPLVDVRGDLVPPALSGASRRDVDSAPLSSRLSVVLPRAQGRTIALDPAGVRSRQRAWASCSTRFFEEGADTEDWAPDSPGWTALGRLATAAPGLIDPHLQTGERELVAFTRLELADFLFIDNVYYLTHLAPLVEDHSALVACGRCAREFLPLARSPCVEK
jgi:hypothetical protein